jgi:kynureninase
MSEELSMMQGEDDSLANLRKSFSIPKKVIYLNGNSLGPLQFGVKQRLKEVVDVEWGEDLITSWNKHGWMDLPARVGEKIAPIIGASKGQVICCDSISINLFKLLASAMQLRPDRRKILSQVDNFPSDLYVAEGLERMLGKSRCALELQASRDLAASLDSEVAVLMLSHVNFRDGSIHDVANLTRKAHENGTLVIWDLAHSAGVLSIALDDWDVDFAVGCGYKYLHGGPGAPSFLYVNKRLHDQFIQPLQGWMGHEKPFQFDQEFVPAAGIRQFVAGTPQILSLVALDSALEIFDDLDICVLQEKASLLSEYFLELVSKESDLDEFQLISPTDPSKRAAQLSFSHPSAYAISRAWIEEGVIADFRAPNILRVGFSPMTLSFKNIDLAVEKLILVVRNRTFLKEKFQEKQSVT